MQIPKNNIYSVSKLNGEVRQLLEGNLSRIWLSGEISNFAAPGSGHWYLTLKDTQSQIRCAMFKGRNQAVTFRPTNGMQVLVRGNISVYEPRGDYQLLIDAMLPAGDGLLAQEFEALKMKLAAEGLFALETKRPLPDNIRRIGVITSPTGAAIRDVLHVLARRDPALEVIIYPSQVQGTAATDSLIQAITLANRRLEVDVLLLTRGGGSLEDLWCFNHESLAHAIYNSALPVVSAVGHEVDTTIADYVADLRAPTPSAGAELLSRDKAGRLQQLTALEGRLKHSWDHCQLKLQRRHTLLAHRLSQQDPVRTLEQLAQRFDEMQLKLSAAMARQLHQAANRQTALAARLTQQTPAHKLAMAQNRLEYLAAGLHQALDDKLKQARGDLGHCAHLLENVSPLATLSRGYSITTDDKGRVIDNSAELNNGDTLHTRLKQGSVISTVISTE
ncbi:exodeoxyribonuclease 7 large subunit [Shewanella sp. NFH-SH190041]|uniref:exodeoxyribonuclease VII large subunit n=1 Tax=Shewanella sp. NFH-SH190041 TaxID=2950245 RepID=UPI0021C25B9E|nr:exodeoxyribonuclease VII large subunit [Shewanella sp. NFH-SH190041]BDM63703.1 exodeoxyribonuclease 7 large subunit [Shewanella sp. NFH-SH190041]